MRVGKVPDVAISEAPRDDAGVTAEDLREAWQKAEGAVSRERNDILLRHEEIVRKGQEEARKRAQEEIVKKKVEAVEARRRELSGVRREDAEQERDLDEKESLRRTLEEDAKRLDAVAAEARRNQEGAETDDATRRRDEVLRRLAEAESAEVEPPDDQRRPRLWMA